MPKFLKDLLWASDTLHATAVFHTCRRDTLQLQYSDTSVKVEDLREQVRHFLPGFWLG